MAGSDDVQHSPEWIASARELWVLRIQGRSLSQIAAYTGQSTKSIADKLHWWREVGSKQESESGESVVEHYRHMSLDRLEYYLSTLEKDISLGNRDAIEQARKLIADERKLLGLDSAEKIAVEAKQTTYIIDGVDLNALK